MASHRLGIDPNAALVKQQQKYFSRAREGFIKVDVVIEVTRPGASNPYLLWVWECKDYAHAVPVDDAEEFHAKLQQIGANKTRGTIVTTGTFQKSTVTYAENMGIGLVRFLPDGSVIRLQESRDRNPILLAYTGLIEPDTTKLQSLFFSLSPSGTYVLDLHDLIKAEFENIARDSLE